MTTWTDASAVWQAVHGDASQRTEDAFRYLYRRAGGMDTSANVQLVRSLVSAVSELREGQGVAA